MAVAMPFVPAEPTPQQRKTVAIIGCGLSGLAAAKAAIQAGLFPTIFDRRRAAGGMWTDGSATYDSLHTNVSRFTCSFSDFPWPASAPDFPSALEVGQYLSAYQRTFLTEENCRLQLGYEVLRVAPSSPDPSLSLSHPAADSSQSPPWRVEWRKVHEPTGLREDCAASADADDSEVDLLQNPESRPTQEQQTSATPASSHTLQAPSRDTAGGSMVSQASTASLGSSDQFDYVVVATGFCAVPHLPDIPGLDTFPGLVLHSAAYRGAHLLRGRRRVAVIGSGHSAADIAADLAAAALRTAAVAVRSPGGSCSSGDSTAAAAATDVPPPQTEVNSGMEVIHATPRPFWLIPRYLPLAAAAATDANGASGAAPPFVPLDVFFHRWSGRVASGRGPEEQVFPTSEDHIKSNAFFSSLCGDQGKLLSPVLAVPRVTSEPVGVAISDSYGPLVASGRLKLRRGRITRVSGCSLELSDENAAYVASASSGSGSGGSDGGNNLSQPLHDVDAIVLCTGLRPALKFLPDELLSKLSYTPYDNYVPLALHRRVLHPDAPGLAFVGVFRSPFFAVVELQARLAAAAFTGALPAEEADPATQYAGVAMELRVRNHTPRTPYPHQDFVGHADGLAAAMGLLPPPGWRTKHDVVMAAHYAGAVLGPKPQPAVAALPRGHGPAANVPGGDAPTAAAATVDGQQGGEAKAAAITEEEEPRTEVPPAVAAVDAVQRALDDVEAAMGEYRHGRRVASAVFYALAGEWALRRRIVSRFPSSPSGEVTGRARFTTIADADFAPAAGGAGGLSYLYDEQGQFAVQGGPVMRVRREYVYTYDNTADRIDVYFADASPRRGGFFHSLRFLSPEGPQNDEDGSSSSSSSGSGGDGCWRAVGDHLCVRDMYDASYRFSFQGIQLREFEIEFRVKGPNKDYTATATYTRP